MSKQTEAMKMALEWVEDATVVLSRTSTAIQGGIGAEAEGLGGCSVKVTAALREALAQPAQASKPWVPVTQELLHEQHPWLYEPMWIAMKDGSVIQGHYEWRQGWNPDRFIAEGFNHWAFDAAYVMPVIKPTPPAIEAAHGIKERNT